MRKLIVAIPGIENSFNRNILPAQWAPIGTVQIAGEGLAGVLVRDVLSGAFGQFNPASPYTVQPLDAVAVVLGFAESACPGCVDIATIDTAEAEQLTNRSRQTIAKWVKEGHLTPCNPEGTAGSRRYLKSDVLAAAARRPASRGKGVRRKKGAAADAVPAYTQARLLPDE
jgi:hypothetical protein